MSSRVIDAVFRLTDQFSAPMESCVSALTSVGKEGKAVRKQLAAVGDTLTSIGTSLTKTVTMPVVAAGAAAISASTDFESAMASVEALISASSESIESDMAALEAAAIEASTGSLYSASDAAEAMYYMGLAGWDSSEMIAGLDSVLGLATAAEMDLSTASDIVTDYLTAFGLTADDAAGFVDQMAYAMSNSNTTVEQLGEAYKNVAATSTQLGYSLEDTTAALMVMADSGIKGGEAGTALASIMTRLGNDTSGCRSMLEEYGVEVYDAEGSVKSLSSILDGMRGIWAGLTDEEKSNLAYTVAGKTAQSELMTLLGDSTGSFEAYAAGLDSCSGAAQDMTDTISGTLSSQVEILKGDLENLGISFGEVLLPYISDAVSYVTQLVESFAALSDSEKDQVIQIAALAAAVGPVLTVFGKLTKTASKVAQILAVVKKAGGALKIALAVIHSPAAVVLGVITAIAAVIAVLVTHTDELKASISAMCEKNAPQLQAIGEAISALTAPFKALFNFVVDVFVSGILGAFDAICTGEGMSVFLEGLATALTGLVDIMQGVIDFIVGVFTLDWEKAWGGIYSVVEGIAEAIAGPIDAICGLIGMVGDAIGGVVSGVAGAVTSLFSGGDTESVTGNASGTNSWRGGITRVGESGGEIINLPSGTQIIPHDLSRNAATAAASSSISIAKLADSIVVREDADIDRITDQLVRKLQKAQANMA